MLGAVAVAGAFVGCGSRDGEAVEGDGGAAASGSDLLRRTWGGDGGGSAGREASVPSRSAASTGGASDGGASDGGASIGGASIGGASIGGASIGGASIGGASIGGASIGGASIGGASSVSSGSASSSSASSSSASTSGGGGGPCVPSQPVDVDPIAPATLAGTGLYADIASKVVGAGVAAYQPQYELWSDGANKLRWIALPECTVVDNSSMDDWSVPVGTKLWKEFEVAGKRVETRLIKRFGPGPSDFVFAAYQWNAGETDAVAVPNGVPNANGTSHDIPAGWECTTCHTHAPARVLGFGAVQLSHDGPGLTVDSLSADGRLEVPQGKWTMPGDSTAAAALGYLHANCGHCHNASPLGVYFADPFVLRLSVTATTVEQTGAYQTAVGAPVSSFSAPGITHRIAPGNPAASCVYYRASVRGSSDQMPPFCTDEVDAVGMLTLLTWISSLSP